MDVGDDGGDAVSFELLAQLLRAGFRVAPSLPGLADNPAGRRSPPASLPAGTPGSSWTMSPGVSIEPGGFVTGEFRCKIPSHRVLAEGSECGADRLVNRLVALGCPSGY